MESYIIYMAFHPQAVRIARLRGEGPSAPGRTLLGSEEEAARLRGGGCSAPGRKYGCKAIDY